MRVLQAIAGDTFGGAENVFVRLVVALHQAGIHQEVLMKPSALRRKPLLEAGVPVYEASFRHLFPFPTWRAFQRRIQVYQPDIVMTWMSRATHLCPTGPFIHVGRLGGFYALKYFKKCHHLVAVTPAIQTHCLEQKWPKEKITHICNFSPIREQCTPADRARFNTPPDVPLILGVGRLHTDKAFDVLIRSLGGVAKAHLWIAGDGPLRKSLRRLSQQSGVGDRVHFLGWQADIQPLFEAVDIVAFPSRVEPLGNVILDSWAYGKPIISAKSSGPRSLIDHEKTGLLIDIDDEKMLSQYLNHLIDNPNLRKTLVEKGRLHYQQFYTQEAILAQYVNFFKSLCR